MINIAEPQIGVEEIQKVTEVLKSKILAQGEFVYQFETSFAKFLDIEFAAAVSSGTAALHAIMAALPIYPGDKVLTTPFSFVASSNAVLYCGAVPVFVDIDPNTYNISPAALEEAIKKHPDAKAVLVVHIFGLPSDMDDICYLTKKNKLYLIEDCAQAHGALYKGRKVGTFGEAAAFSFYSTKNITSGEGGMVVTSSPEINRKVRMFINHGQSKKYQHDILGYNYRMSNIHAAIGIEQLKKLGEFNQKRILNAQYYYKNIKNKKVVLPYTPKESTHVYHQFVLQTENRKKFIKHLHENGVGSAVHYPEIIPRQKLYRDRFNYREKWPAAEKLCRRCVSIPVHQGLTEQQFRYIVKVVNSYA
ncbi:MAG: DegT/DnrJ/EryC1/StrS family aminotransferase [Desulfotomaculum sp.]|nr:DegT/DnrJ/EryC1/StrS family aminotransferase [Desulfotomaculum sp.]